LGLANSRELPLGELPKNIEQIIQTYVDYSIEYYGCPEIKSKGASIAKFKSEWKNSGASKKNQMLKSCRKSGTSENKQWNEHINNSIWYRNRLPSMLEQMFEDIVTKIKYIINQVPRDISGVDYTRLSGLTAESSFRDLLYKPEGKPEVKLEGLNQILNKIRKRGSQESDYRLANIRKLCNMLKWFRNSVEHRNDVTVGHVNEKYSINDVDRYIENLETKSSPEEVLKLVIYYLKIMSLNEEFDGTDETEGIYDMGMLNYYQTTLDNRNLLAETNEKFVKSLLGLKEWKEYIEVEGEDADGDKEVAIKLLIDYFEEGAQLVDICGRGGLGKTALSHEFIHRVTDPEFKKTTNLKFSNYLFFTSKSNKQGEFASSRTHIEAGKTRLNPHNPRLGLAQNYVEDFEYMQFIIQICQLRPGLPVSEKLAIQILTEEDLLVVVDNFEDVKKDEKKIYRKFFRKVSSGRSKIIVTSRDNSESPNTIKLSNLSYPNAFQLLKKRYEFAMGKQEKDESYRGKDLEELRAEEQLIRRAEEQSLVPKENLLQRVKSRIPGEKQYDYERSMTHPLALFLLVSFLFSKKVRQDLNIQTTDSLEDYIVKVANESSYGFLEFHAELRKWSIEKSYEQFISADEDCMLILEILIKSKKPMTEAELRAKFYENGSDMQRVKPALQALLTREGDYLNNTPDERYEIIPMMREFLKSRNSEMMDEEGNLEPNQLFTKDETDLLKLRDLLLKGDYKMFVIEFLKCDWVQTSRQKESIVNLDLALSLLDAMKHIEFDFSHQENALVDKLHSILFPCLELNNPQNIFQSSDRHAEMNDILGLSIVLVAHHTENIDYKKEWIRHSADDIIAGWESINSDNWKLVFDRLFRDQKLFPTAEDDDSYLHAWIYFVAIFHDNGLYNSGSKEIALQTLDVFSNLCDSNSFDEIQERLDRDDDSLVARTIKMFIDTWTGQDTSWSETHRILRNNFELESPKKDWNNIKDWAMYTMLPVINTDSIQETPFTINIYELNESGKSLISVEPDTDYYVSLDRILFYNNPPCIETILVEKLNSTRVDKAPESLESEHVAIVETCREIIIAGMKNSIHEFYYHSDLKKEYAKREGIGLEAAVRTLRTSNKFTSSSEFVLEYVIPSFQRISASQEGKPNQLYIRTSESMDEAEQEYQKSVVNLDSKKKEQDLRDVEQIVTSPAWMKFTNIALRNYFTEKERSDFPHLLDKAAGKSLNIIRRNKQQFELYNRLKGQIEQLLDEGLIDIEEIMSATYIHFNCDMTNVKFFLDSLE
tara:strand:- start:243 stop:4076 length:3834 start_codon:yes stop_codon:yes gene_type:complete